MVGFVDIAQHCAPAVSVSTMAAIVKTESSFNPLAIGINVDKNEKKPKIATPKTANEAVTTANWLLSHGYNIDIGLGQINSANLSRLGVSVDDMFNPCSNINAAGTILKGNYSSYLKDAPNEQAALRAAISGYNTGSPTKGFGNGYVKAVISNSNFANLNSIEIHVPDLVPSNDTAELKPASPRLKLEAVASEETTATSGEKPLVQAEQTPKKEISPEKRVMVYDSGVSEEANSVMVY